MQLPPHTRHKLLLSPALEDYSVACVEGARLLPHRLLLSRHNKVLEPCARSLWQLSKWLCGGHRLLLRCHKVLEPCARWSRYAHFLSQTVRYTQASAQSPMLQHFSQPQEGHKFRSTRFQVWNHKSRCHTEYDTTLTLNSTHTTDRIQ